MVTHDPVVGCKGYVLTPREYAELYSGPTRRTAPTWGLPGPWLFYWMVRRAAVTLSHRAGEWKCRDGCHEVQLRESRGN